MNPFLSTLSGSLDHAAADTLETMFFSAIGPATEEPPTEPRIFSLVEFRGDASGALELALPLREAAGLTANFLGIERSEVSEGQLLSACGEMANMICGCMVSHAAPEGRFELSAPAVVVDVPDGPPGQLCRFYLTETGSLRITVRLDTQTVAV